MRKYWVIYKAGLQNALAYRGPMVVWKITGIVFFITIAYVWLQSDTEIIGGYTKPQLITYYLFVLYIQWVIMWTPVTGIKDSIKTGEISGQALLKPVSHIRQMLSLEISWHTVSAAIGFVGLVPVLFLFQRYIVVDFEISKLLVFLLVLPLSGLVCFLISYIFGIFAFWFTEVDGLVSLFWLMLFLFGGQGIPLSFFPEPARSVVMILPFRYVFSFPLETMFNKISNLEIIAGLSMQLLWVITLYFIAMKIWRAGVRVYSAYGS